MNPRAFRTSSNIHINIRFLSLTNYILYFFNKTPYLIPVPIMLKNVRSPGICYITTQDVHYYQYFSIVTLIDWLEACSTIIILVNIVTKTSHQSLYSLITTQSNRILRPPPSSSNIRYNVTFLSLKNNIILLTLVQPIPHLLLKLVIRKNVLCQPQLNLLCFQVTLKAKWKHITILPLKNHIILFLSQPCTSFQCQSNA